jgi:hypothetical protein
MGVNEVSLISKVTINIKLRDKEIASSGCFKYLGSVN